MKQTRNRRIVFPALPARGRKGSKRHGGYNRHGKGSHYHGGY
ncbi:hypothetical protein [Gordonia asplenii]|nr:hypothetical protein [Gordonia asplenii]